MPLSFPYFFASKPSFTVVCKFYVIFFFKSKSKNFHYFWALKTLLLRLRWGGVRFFNKNNSFYLGA